MPEEEVLTPSEQAKRKYQDVPDLPIGETIVGPMAGNSEGDMEFDEDHQRESMKLDDMTA